jgi:tRNA-Thr(GGU) m(6)t(6)A37 methyltransferase TsaA
MFERYTEDARRVLFFARCEATKLGGLSIAPEHLLLGLVREGHRRLREMLSAASVTLEDARRMVEAHTAAGASVPLEKEIPFQPATSRILQLAVSEADALSHPYIGSEHLLLGMLRGEDPVAAAYLTRAGVQLSRARDVAAAGRESDPLAMALPAPTYSGRRIVLTPIGTVQSAFTDTADIPKGLGAEHRAEGVLDIRPDLEEGLADIDGFSHLYVIWFFDRVDRAELTAHPPTDDRPHGVFSTRSPQRPNPIGLTVVELLRREGTRLHVRGLDMLDGTPILDIKPYLSSIPPESLRRGWLAEAEQRKKKG